MKNFWWFSKQSEVLRHEHNTVWKSNLLEPLFVSSLRACSLNQHTHQLLQILPHCHCIFQQQYKLGYSLLNMAAPLRQYNIFSWTKFSAAPMLTICRGLDCVSVTVGVESYPESQESTKLGDTHLNCNWTDWRAFHKPPDHFTGTVDGYCFHCTIEQENYVSFLISAAERVKKKLCQSNNIYQQLWLSKVSF